MFSIVALSGPKSLLNTMNLGEFDSKVEFPTPEDHGGFPDTRAESMENFDEVVVTDEDPALLRYMKNCVDAVMDYGHRKVKSLDLLGFKDIKFDLHGHTFGGKVFAVTGFVHYKQERINLKGITIH